MLVASDGLPRLELFKGKEMVDTIQVHRHSVEGIEHLLESQLNQARDLKRNYKDLNAGDKLD
mgnify:CR=1 FL=1